MTSILHTFESNVLSRHNVRSIPSTAKAQFWHSALWSHLLPLLGSQPVDQVDSRPCSHLDNLLRNRLNSQPVVQVVSRLGNHLGDHPRSRQVNLLRSLQDSLRVFLQASHHVSRLAFHHDNPLLNQRADPPACRHVYQAVSRQASHQPVRLEKRPPLATPMAHHLRSARMASTSPVSAPSTNLAS